MKQNKGNILRATVSYVRKLQRNQRDSREIEMRQKQLEETNRRLQIRIQVIIPIVCGCKGLNNNWLDNVAYELG